MLEGLVANLLNRFLGMYVRNFDPKQLNIGIWSGDVKLHNLELRREALDQLKLPLNVIEGHIGELTLSIPWSNLKGKPVKVFIEDVFILAAPKKEAEYDQSEEEDRQIKLKLEKLESAEILRERNEEGLSKEEQQKSQSFTESLVNKIVDNLQVSVKNIHVRYEDSLSAPGHPFALGVTLQEFSAFSTDGNWNAAFISGTQETTHKLAKLGALAVYWDTDCEFFTSGEGDVTEKEAHTALMDKFKDTEYISLESSSRRQYLLKPVTGEGKLEVSRSLTPEHPRFKAALSFEEIGLVLDEDQYRDALLMVDLFHFYIRHQQYKKLKPKGVSPKEDPRAWLLFAGNAVLDKIHERNYKWSWDYFRERRDNRRRYIELFKEKKKGQVMPAGDQDELNALERKLSYEDLRFWRSLARNQLRKEKALVRQQTQSQPQQNQGWAAWIWGSSQAQKQAPVDETSNTGMTDEQRKELYEAIDFDEKKAIAESIDVPRETVKLQIEASLDAGSFTLKRDPHGSSHDIFSLRFDLLETKVLQRPDSFLAKMTLGGFSATDGTTEGSLYPNFVRVKDTDVKSNIKAIESSEVSPKDSNLSLDKLREDPFFQFEFEQNPLDGTADSNITAKLKSMEIIYNAAFISEVAGFFRPPERHMESITALMETAGNTVDSIRKQTRAGLEFALEEHKTINAKLDLQAPLLILPESVTVKDCQCLIVDAGHVSLNSELVEKNALQEIRSKQKKRYSERDYERLEGLMYDKFLLKLEATQVLIGPSLEATKAQLDRKGDVTNMHIVDRINIDFVLQVSILPKAPNLTKFKISGHLPILHASISDKKYKSLMRLIDVAIPKSDDTAPPQTTTLIRPQATTERPVSAIFTNRQPSSKEPDLTLSDHESDSESDQEGSDKFEEAPLGHTEDAVLKQTTFQFAFTVDELRGSLYKADDSAEGKDKLLVEVVAQHFELTFYLRQYEMVADVILRSLSVDDHVDENPTPEFQRIVTSRDSDDKQVKDLVSVHFVKVKEESPEFMTIYEAIATNVDVSISTINIVVTRKTLLTLLDFILVTFTNPDQAPQQKAIESGPGSGAGDKQDEPKPQEQENKIKVKVDLTSIVMILNNDGIKLATLRFTTADVAVFLRGNSMRVGVRLGNLSLTDDINQGAEETSPLRQLISIQGNELADFRYETYDPKNTDTYPGYSTSLYLRSGSIKVNFIQEPFRKILDFLVKFGRMQAVFNAARLAAMNQANQIQENVGKLHFDVLVRTPIVVFTQATSADSPHQDNITAYLGELYAENKFVDLDNKGDPSANQISAGIRNVRLTSTFYYEEGEISEELELIDKVDANFDITNIERDLYPSRPDLAINGDMTDFTVRMTPSQLRFLLELSRTVPGVFSTSADDTDAELQSDPKVPTETGGAALTKRGQEDDRDSSKELVNLGPEIKHSQDTWTKLDFVFKVPTVGLELVRADLDKPVEDEELHSLSKFAINEIAVKLKMTSDSSIQSELSIKSFTIKDSRKNDTNKFRRVLSSTNDVGQQLMCSVTISGGQDRNLIAMVTLDSPRVIFALDYIFAVVDFVNQGLTPYETDMAGETSIYEGSSVSGTATAVASQQRSIASTDAGTAVEPKSQETAAQAMSISFRVNIVDAQIILIANPTTTASEAIVLSTSQIIMSQQHAMTMQIAKVGMYLCRMDHVDESRLRILDNFGITMSMETRSSNPQAIFKSINIAIEPLLLRLSLRDIILVLSIVQKASELSAGDVSKPAQPSKPDRGALGQRPTDLKRRTASGKAVTTTVGKSVKAAQKSVSSSTAERNGHAAGYTIASREELEANLDGLRIILIGDLHELPLLDFNVKPFTVHAQNWTSAMQADTSFEPYINVYNFSKSAWEPLLEPWQLGLHVARDQSPPCLSVEVYSRKTMELTVTASTMATAVKSMKFLSQDNEEVLSKPRSADSPYKIRNHTGFDLNVWVDPGPDKEPPAPTKISDGEESSWRFEDWETTRETLSVEITEGLIGIRLEGSGFDSIKRVPINREGESIYSLRPKKDKILHRLLIEVKLGPDNIKYVTIRSPLLVENKTQLPIELGIFNAEEGHLEKIEKILPGEGRPAPVGAAYFRPFLIRPDQGFGYSWSQQKLYWKDLLQKPIRTVSCRGEAEGVPSFYFQIEAVFKKSDPLPKVYPCMRIQICAPVEVHNLLPYDFKYRIYDKNTKKDWTNFLRRGGVSPVHVVELSHLLLMSINMQDTPYVQSEFAIINSTSQDEFSQEQDIIVKDKEGLTLTLKLHYFKIPDGGGAFKVSIYSPYVILNKTGLSINIKSKGFLGHARSAAGQSFSTDAPHGGSRKALPYMFSYGTEERQNRAILRVGDSDWSKPQSFDAIGSKFDVVLPSVAKRSEIHVGITVEEGQGKYKLTKVVTLAPRFIVKNEMGCEISVREPGSSQVMTMQDNELLPLHFLRQSHQKQLTLCYPGINNHWTSPFTISDLGSVHVKIAKSGQRQRLVRVDILMEQATIFLHLSMETKHWPFSMRNESDIEFTFFQTNPHIDDDDEEESPVDQSGWRPVRYLLPPRSIMPYAWDYPAAKNKELVLQAHNKERRVRLEEIGNLIPMKLPAVGREGRQKIIDINVAADGPTQTLILSNYKASTSMYKQKSSTTSTTSVAAGFEAKDLDSDVTFKAQLRLAGIGLSLINRQLKELAYATMREAEIKYTETELLRNINVQVKWMQIDNQLYGGIFPIILYPSVVPKTGKEMDVHPSFSSNVTIVKDDSYGVLYIKYATLLLQEMTLEIDEDFIFALLDFSKIPGRGDDDDAARLCDESLDIPEPHKNEQGTDVYFEVLNIQPAQMDLSFVRTERVNVEDKTSTRNPLMFFFNILTMAIGNINDAPVRLNSLVLENARVSAPVLIQHVQNHYSQEFFYQIHKILGSADFLGNPVGLFNNISSGVADIFYEPYQGFVMTDRPQELGYGIAKGATSFFKKSVFGVSDSFSKVTGSISKGLTAATMDKQFQDRRRLNRVRNRPKHALYGVTEGANSFVTSVASGVGGLARKPLEGAEKEGVAGFFKGVGKGVVGLATKPAIGFFDLASNVSEGIRNTTTVFDAEGLDRVRLTRFIGDEGIVRPYGQREALGQYWLKQLDNGKYFSDNYIAHLELPREDVVVILTYTHILLAKSKKLTTEWVVPLKDIQTISKERTGLSVTLRGGTNGPFIPVADESSRNFLYQKIGVAVRSFNAKYRTLE